MSGWEKAGLIAAGGVLYVAVLVLLWAAVVHSVRRSRRRGPR